MKDNVITAYFMRVDEEEGIPYKGYLSTIENTLSAKQRYVNFDEDGGLIEVVHLNREIDVICHDEGKILGYPINRAWVDKDGEVIELFAGNILAVRHSEDEFASISEADIPHIKKHLCPVVVLNGGIVLKVPEEDLPEYKGVDDGNTN